MSRLVKFFVHTFTSTSLLTLLACGGGGGGSNLQPGTPNNNSTPSWTAGTFENESNFKNLCQTPRSGTDLNGNSFPDQAGTTLHENHWLRSWSNNTYLWYNEIVDQNPASFTTAAYFNSLKTNATTPSGGSKDSFHFSLDTADWQQQNQAGVSSGFGVSWAIIKASVPREVRVALVEPGSPAANNLSRGGEILEVDGVDLVNSSDIDAINAALFPSSEGESHTFSVRDVGSDNIRSISMTSAAIASTPVQNVSTINTATGTVGYMLFNSHIQTAEKGLFDAVTQLASANVTDLVLDLRYNGGGLLNIASQLGYMIAGPTLTAGKTFDSLTFNDKHQNNNPVTGQTLAPTPFISQSVGFSMTAGQPLPSLNLNRVFILSTGRTCSASEAIINGLRGVDVEVILIGATTCGKPYGFYPTDNCGTTYFTIQFKGQNDKGFGEYSDGFSPANTIASLGEIIPGCSVADDFLHQLGDPEEAQLAAALAYRVSNSCPTPALTSAAKSSLKVDSLFNSKRYQQFRLTTENGFLTNSDNQ